MTLGSISQKLHHWLEKGSGPLKIEGFSPEVWSYFLKKHSVNLKEASPQKTHHVIATPSDDIAEKFYDNAKREVPGFKVHYLPSIEHSPYSGVIPPESSLFHRFRTFQELANHPDQHHIIVASFDSLMLKGPDVDFFKQSFLTLSISDIISPDELRGKLLELGYSHSTTVEEPGSFGHRGEIFDIFLNAGQAIRIHYFDDMIEEIFEIDLETQKTLRDKTFETIKITATPRIFSNDTFRTQLRDSIPMPAPQFKEKFERRKKVFEQLSMGMLFDNYPYFIPLFFKNPSTLFDFVSQENTLLTFLEDWETRQSIPLFIDEMKKDFEDENERIDSENILPEPQKIFDLSLFENIENNKTIFVSSVGIEADLDNSFVQKISTQLESANSFLRNNVNPTLAKSDFIRESILFLNKEFQSKGQVVFTTPNKSSKDEILYLLDLLEVDPHFRKRLTFEDYKLSQGFYYSAENTLVLTDGDLFSNKRNIVKKSRTKDVDLFAEQLSTLKSGDFVIHTDHGMGVYKGLETLNIGTTPSDYLIIEYTGNDKIYVPVYKMNLIQKHADASASLKPDSLRTNKFIKSKTRAKESAKKLAFDLLKLQAERQSSKAFAFNEPDHHYRDFELSFPFQETEDQKAATEDVLHSMQKPVPMDHLVCGDVGFGKTEIAMRAAYKAVLDHKQVCVLVPTTVLALQHFNSFSKRFNDFPVEIDFISRFKTPKEVKEIKKKLELGKIDIIIGTHKLLSDKIKYHDLGLVIVDEEQRFGVGHKEKLKLLKASVDFLTLTATPIPRTLQLAFLGLRDLSLIKTAPPKRQSIKSYLIKQDDRTLKAAIEKELSRGGQVFIVHNKVQDMEIYEQKIRELIPNASIISAHGQMPEKELEKRMKAFYSGQYQILISTTIIESGLDIPNANTMIIDRADTFGLSQLHQLRGRIGRSDRKAYCYFVIPGNKVISTVAQKRLQALQTYADMGSGFNIATSDLEIRGAGDILGAHQSGHVDAVGLELYMELLKEAIHELRGEKTLFKKDIEINTPFAAYIPNNFITDSSERLKTYKKLSNCEDINELKEIEEELFDMYGAFPKELKNLIAVLEVRCQLQRLGLKSVQVGGRLITMAFDEKYLESYPDFRNKIVETFIQRPKTYQFTPDFKVIYTHKNELSPGELLEFSQDIAQQILPC